MPILRSTSGVPETRRPLIVAIRRGSLEDGPGMRSVVFFKGCPLRCVFCHNPETQETGPELAFVEERCVHCASCAQACSQGAIDLSSPFRVDRSKCDLCGRCEDTCPASAMQIVGKYWSADRLVELLLRDVAFYRHSGGGVTLSGGECTLFPDYVQTLLRKLQSHSIHVTIETCGVFDYQVFAKQILPFVNLILFDMKLVDGAESKRYLGRSNTPILENLRSLLEECENEVGVRVQIRVPLIPGITDTRANMSGIVEILRDLGVRDLYVLSYNPLGLATYRRLGKRPPDLPQTFTPLEREAEAIGTLRSIIASRHCSAPCG
jgi:pyruvate formate lyase activating enzyme